MITILSSRRPSRYPRPLPLLLLWSNCALPKSSFVPLLSFTSYSGALLRASTRYPPTA